MLLPILGTSWVFGMLAVNRQAVIFQYVFALLNSLQVGTPGHPRWAWEGLEDSLSLFPAHTCEPKAWRRPRPEASMGHPRVPVQMGPAGSRPRPRGSPCGTNDIQAWGGTVSTWGLLRARGTWRGGDGGTSV